MKFGYARVSSQTQDINLQIDALKNYGCEKIFSETISAKDNNRPELNSLIDKLRDGDTVVIYKIDRIARSLKGLIDLIDLLREKNVNLISLDSGDNVDTTSPMGKAFFQIAGVFAELERGMINARTKAGIARAQESGVKFGRVLGSRSSKTNEKLEHVEIYLNAGKSYGWICQQLNISKNTVSRVKKTLM